MIPSRIATKDGDRLRWVLSGIGGADVSTHGHLLMILAEKNLKLMGFVKGFDAILN
jgi:hypothetical protein